jgi:uncharacterized protein YdaU (DUF1376 family)
VVLDERKHSGSGGMNYYERHIGDYLKDTAHLSLLEHGVYTRLMDVYYTREGAIPAGEAARLIGARSKDEREALKTVLAEFFVLVDGAHRQDRCEREIDRFKDKQRKAIASANARWSKGPTHTDRNANASPDAMRTHSEGNAPRARPQTPDTISTPKPPEGADMAGDNPVTVETKPRSAAIGLKAWLEAVKAKGEKPIPPSDPVFAYAEQVGLPDDFLHLAWLEFRRRYSDPDAKRYRDWRKVFRKAVAGNWMRLWFAQPDGSYALTTAGMQAKRSNNDDERKAA